MELKNLEHRAKLRALEKLRGKDEVLTQRLSEMQAKIKEINGEILHIQREFSRKMEDLAEAEEIYFQKKQEKVVLNSSLSNAKTKLGRMNCLNAKRLEQSPSSKQSKGHMFKRQNSSINCYQSL